jgi:hypothetical protein
MRSSVVARASSPFAAFALASASAFAFAPPTRALTARAAAIDATAAASTPSIASVIASVDLASSAAS